jgi:signal transduction histidine kinase
VSITAYVAFSVTARALESRVEAQIVSAATFIGQTDFALNPTILRSVRAIAGADVVTYSTGGQIVASTLDPDASEALVNRLTAEAGSGVPTDAPAVLRLDCGVPCNVAYWRMPGRPDTIVAVMTTATELTAATQAVARTILGAAVVSLAVMLLVSQLVARGITAPIEALVRFTRDVAGGRPGLRARAGDDEVGRLGRAFNDMLDELDRSRESLVRSEKLALAGMFAARVAHDVRNPLSSIKMQAQLLRARLPRAADEQSDQLLDAIRRDILQVETVVRDLLELARPGAVDRRPAALNDLVEEALEQVSLHLAYRKVQVTRRLQSGLPDVPLDAARLKQALLNLIHNAADAMPQGGTLSVATRMDESAVAVDIADDGVGISADLLPRVFDPFVSTKPDGIGLGLVNARAVVEQHQGRIELAPRASGGTRVTIWLPIQESARG